MTRGLFITGTDTGVGKTVVACALLRAYSMQGLRAVGMKPIAVGLASDASCNDDVAALAGASNVRAPQPSRNPYEFVPAIAPHVAARAAGVAIDLGRIRAAFDDLATRADRIVVEGAGGALVPLDERRDMLDIAQVLSLPVLLVVGMRLGCLNHALLSALAIRARALPFTGWVANCIDPAFAAAEANIATLEQRLAAPRIATIAWGGAAEVQWATGATLPGRM
jgi:dethiobiotin synthetase